MQKVRIIASAKDYFDEVTQDIPISTMDLESLQNAETQIGNLESINKTILTEVKPQTLPVEIPLQENTQPTETKTLKKQTTSEVKIKSEKVNSRSTITIIKFENVLRPYLKLFHIYKFQLLIGIFIIFLSFLIFKTTSKIFKVNTTSRSEISSGWELNLHHADDSTGYTQTWKDIDEDLERLFR